MNQNLEQVLRHPRQTGNMPDEARGLAATDVDRDGQIEILVLLPDSILAFRDTGREIRKVWEAPLPSGMEATTISTGDIDGNGQPEVFVAGRKGDYPASQALEWFGTALATKGKRIPAFVRAVDGREGSPVLLGRISGAGKEVFAAGVYRFAWTGAAYEREEKYPTPPRVQALNLDFVVLEKGRQPFTLMTTASDRLQVYDSAGGFLVETADSVKGSPRMFEQPRDGSEMYNPEVLRVQGRSAGWTASDGTPYLFLYRNRDKLGRIFARAASFGQGKMMVLRYDGLSLLPETEGPALPGFIADIVAAPAPRVRTMYAALVRSRGTFGRKSETTLLAYDLP
jgi:hypothetical protein